jgi:hypothetical protein
MEEISGLEREVIKFISVMGAVALFGRVIPLTVAPVEAAILTGYEKIKGNREKIKELYEGNIYRILSHGS